MTSWSTKNRCLEVLFFLECEAQPKKTESCWLLTSFYQKLFAKLSFEPVSNFLLMENTHKTLSSTKIFVSIEAEDVCSEHHESRKKHLFWCWKPTLILENVIACATNWLFITRVPRKWSHNYLHSIMTTEKCPCKYLRITSIRFNWVFVATDIQTKMHCPTCA